MNANAIDSTMLILGSIFAGLYFNSWYAGLAILFIVRACIPVR